MSNPEIVNKPVLLRPLLQTAFIFCGILGPLFFLIVYFTFGSVSPDFDMLRQPVGDLQLINYGWIQSANFILFGIFVFAYAVGLRMELESGFGCNAIPAAHMCIALGAIMLGIFVKKPVHIYASIFVVASIVVSLFLFARRFKGDPRWKGWTVATSLCAVAVIALAVLYWHANHTKSNFSGVFERMLVAIRSIWTLVFILKLLYGTRLKPVESDLETHTAQKLHM
jgi:hypothetical protein